MCKKEIEKIEKAQKEIEGKTEFMPLKIKLDAIYEYVQGLQNISDYPCNRREDLLVLEEKLKNDGVDDYNVGKFDEWWKKHRKDTTISAPKE